MNKNTKSNPPKRRVNRLIVSVAVVATVVWMSILLILLNNVSGSTDPIRKVGDQFQVPADWVLVKEQIEPPRFFCTGDNACPSLHRSWNVSNDFSTTSFIKTLEASGIDFKITSNCMENSDSYGSALLCSATGKRDNFEMNVTLWLDNQPTTKRQVVLNME